MNKQESTCLSINVNNTVVISCHRIMPILDYFKYHISKHETGYDLYLSKSSGLDYDIFIPTIIADKLIIKTLM